MSVDRWRLLWAKSQPPHALWRHLFDIAAVAKALLPRFGGIEPLSEEWVLYLVAMHDIGKVDPFFQGKDEAMAGKLVAAGLAPKEKPETVGFRHEAASAEWMTDVLGAMGCSPRGFDPLVGAIKGHHGNFRAKNEGRDGLSDPEWSVMARQISEIVAATLGAEPQAIPVASHASACGLKLVGLIVLSDWIASSDERYGYPSLPLTDDLQAYWEAAQVEGVRAVCELGLNTVARTIPTQPPTFVTVWPEIQSLRPSQRAAQEAMAHTVRPGLAIVEAQMGEGKTEIAIALAEHWNAQLGQCGAYIALPTQATSNQMHGRYHAYLERARPERLPLLVHGMAWLVDDRATLQNPETYGDEDESARAHEWFHSTKRALLAPEAVGTVDQALMGALNVKHGFLRLFGLTHKTLIVDEVHAYDTYMSAILENLLSWCAALRVPVVLLSATLSRRQKAALVAAYTGEDLEPTAPDARDEPYPLLTFAPFGEAPRAVSAIPDAAHARTVTLEARPLLGDPAETARLALHETRNGGCACVIANTVKDAQAIYKVLGEFDPHVRRLLFHARFRAEKRNGIENDVLRLFGKTENGVPNLRRPACAILVATQVVEQSLDIDFDVMISQVAPIDLLLQRMGRLWRHTWNVRHKREHPTFFVLTPEVGGLDFGVSEKVYEAESLLRTLALLEGRTTIHLPGDLRLLVESCYGGAPLPGNLVPAEKLAAAVTKRKAKEADQRKIASEFLLAPPRAGSFSLTNAVEGFDEADESDRASYLRASTRLGDDSSPALVLHDANLIALALDEARIPDRRQLRQLFQSKVNLSRYRLSGAEAATGSQPMRYNPPWARNHFVIPLTNGRWEGTRDGKPCGVHDHPELGILYLEGSDA